jgi:hypothetical protein
MNFMRCRTCVMPNTRPDTPFIDGECSACVSYRKRATIDWEAREQELIDILDRHDGRCIVPSSGGKDSHWQVLKLLELGADVTIVTARTCHLTEIGRKNIDNLARYARTIEVVPNMTVRAKLNRLALEMVGDISWPEHAAIFSTPIKLATDLGIKLLFYGECPQEAYGGPVGSDEAKKMTRRWTTEFGGFLGLRPSDFVGIEGITTRDMEDYEPLRINWDGSVHGHALDWDVEPYFLGQFYEWDSRRNGDVAVEHGMRTMLPTSCNLWHFENLDNAQTGIHDLFMRLKYGFGRGCQQISVDVRSGYFNRESALAWVESHDKPTVGAYAGVEFSEILGRIGMTREAFDACVERFSAV